MWLGYLEHIISGPKWALQPPAALPPDLSIPASPCTPALTSPYIPTSLPPPACLAPPLCTPISLWYLHFSYSPPSPIDFSLLKALPLPSPEPPPSLKPHFPLYLCLLAPPPPRALLPALSPILLHPCPSSLLHPSPSCPCFPLSPVRSSGPHPNPWSVNWVAHGML